MINWLPIKDYPQDEQPLVLISKQSNSHILWAIFASHQTQIYGYIQCAQRTGWLAYMPQIALEYHDFTAKPRDVWIKSDEPTHFAYINK